MFRTFLALATTAALAASSTSAQICTAPVQQAFMPCECKENALQVFCNSNVGDVSPVFQRASALLDENLIFEEVYIRGQPMSTLPANFFGNLKFRKIHFEGGPALNWVHPDAFNSTTEATRILTFYDAYFTSTEENHDLWTAIGKFRNLEELNLYSNQIQYIPDDPFPEPMLNLWKIELDYNQVDYWGARFVANLPVLQEMRCVGCGLTLDDFSAATFEGVTTNMTVRITWNDFHQLPEPMFKSVLSTAKELLVGGMFCDWLGCTISRLDCDEGIHWICEDVDFYEPRLDGYYCTDRTRGDHIWVYCDSIKSNATIQ